MKKYTWTSDETFCAQIKIAHYGPKDLENKKVSWEIKGDNFIRHGTTDAVDIPTGAVTDAGFFWEDLGSILNISRVHSARAPRRWVFGYSNYAEHPGTQAISCCEPASGEERQRSLWLFFHKANRTS